LELKFGICLGFGYWDLEFFGAYKLENVGRVNEKRGE
jgi:hypothetical protein